jgi:hypothetical protein
LESRREEKVALTFFGLTVRTGGELLRTAVLTVGIHEQIKEGQNVAAVFNHAAEDVAEGGLAFRFAVPLCENGWGHLDIAAQLLGGMASQKESVKKRRLALRHGEIVCRFSRDDL